MYKNEILKTMGDVKNVANHPSIQDTVFPLSVSASKGLTDQDILDLSEGLSTCLYRVRQER
jgi:hypothetical protein